MIIILLIVDALFNINSIINISIIIKCVTFLSFDSIR